MGDALQTDIQRALLGTIVVELIAIIILLSICIKLNPKKKQPENEEHVTRLKTTRSITLPSFQGTQTSENLHFQSDLFKTASNIDVAALGSDASTLTAEGSSRDAGRKKSQDSELSTWSDGQRLTKCSDKHDKRGKKLSWFRSKSLTTRSPEEHTTPKKCETQNNNSLPLGFML